MEELIKKELFKTVESFLNEIDLTMEYLDPQIVPSIRIYMKTIDLDKEEYNKFLEYITQHLGTYESKISAILFSAPLCREACASVLKNYRLNP